MRIAAFLELTDARGFVVLSGRWAAHADLIARLSDTPLVVVNPAGPVGDVAGIMIVGDTLPMARGSARGAALDADERLARSIVGAVRAGGRVMGPVALPLPATLSELVRDDRVWVAEKNVAPNEAPRLTPITRAKR